MQSCRGIPKIRRNITPPDSESEHDQEAERFRIPFQHNLTLRTLILFSSEITEDHNLKITHCENLSTVKPGYNHIGLCDTS